ncbi:helix-turn-helix domain-containing protein [Vibrio cholerae]|uniref:helix-turn-helix domain-containing protein n=1 Tax=Vibrio cholerae TaxID=666 RepID=UPI00061594B0|nr:helix-turn-helix domain-containing protein [Vibrio cholerae]AKB03959.1 helix-turn-helix family protein [Vibrio cholerae]AKB04665.1 helix-turn-helix family protein [Vibrio cholerae]EGR2420531.1 helix-turn-helix domain-containing protein [Vibrio cholerae]EIC9842279.1 helix-turn-helix domain-containing protein [Vibrio cholerae]EJK2994518.1 helix-turn-helix domain-containing protein [Vibrio cholerae]
MTELELRAQRFKDTIKNIGGYEYVSQKTGINLRTLKRIAAGQTDPRFEDAIAIARATESSLNYIAYGMLTEDEEESAASDKRMMELVGELSGELFKEIADLRAELHQLKGEKEKRQFASLSKAQKYKRSLQKSLLSDNAELPEPQSEEELSILLETLKETAQRKHGQLKSILSPTQEKSK